MTSAETVVEGLDALAPVRSRTVRTECSDTGNRLRTSAPLPLTSQITASALTPLVVLSLAFIAAGRRYPQRCSIFSMPPGRPLAGATPGQEKSSGGRPGPTASLTR